MRLPRKFLDGFLKNKITDTLCKNPKKWQKFTKIIYICVTVLEFDLFWQNLGCYYLNLKTIMLETKKIKRRLL